MGIFIFRARDIWNEKVFRVRFADCPDELRKLRSRLGYATLFPFIQPEQATFDLNLAVYDERICASMIVELAGKESPLHNLRNPSWYHANGKKDPLTVGVPKSWSQFDKCSNDGTFQVSYECAPEERNYAHRVKILETYGYWKTQVPEADV